MISRAFTITNFIIGSCALSFQIFVLEPWHDRLDAKFLELKKEHQALLKKHGEDLAKMREQIALLQQEKAKKGWF